MALFQYRALDAQGKSHQGRLQAEDRQAVLRAVEVKGLIPVEVTAQGASKQGARVPQTQVMMFSRQLSSLLASGVPLSRAMTVLERETRHAGAAAAWARMHAMVRDGSSLADAMAAEHGVFAPVFIAMVRSGEAGGFLDAVLEQVSAYLEQINELRHRVTTALVYPALLSVVAVAVVSFMLTWFIPKFSEIFDSFDRQLPALTLAIQWVSDLMIHHGLWLVLGIVLLLLLAKVYLKTPHGQKMADRLLLYVPILGHVRIVLARVRFCRTVGTLLASGVPLLAALDVARESLGSQEITHQFDKSVENIRQGGSMVESLASCRQLLPPTIIESLAVAEASGRLDKELLRVAESSDKELDRLLRTLVALVEPVLLLLMAALVGTIVVGMLLPMFDLWGAIQ